MFETKNSQADSSGATCDRLLDAAGEVFAEQGFKVATVREICRRAGANIAAVNYHFGDKAGLYKATLKYADRCAVALRGIPSGDGGAEVAPEQMLAMYVRAYVAAAMDTGRPQWHGRLIAREIMEPSPALDEVVTENIRPRSEMLGRVVRRLLGSAATDERVRLTKFSVIGQCLMYHSGRHVMERLHPEQGFGPEAIDGVAEHITRFSLAAIAGIREQAEGGRR